MPAKRAENAILYASEHITPMDAMTDRRAIASEGKDGATKKGVE
jgi:hypothetical protein